MSWFPYSMFVPNLEFNGRCLIIGKLYLVFAWGSALERDAG